MMDDTQTLIKFAETRDSLSSASIAKLIDLADGIRFSIYVNELIFYALESRGLIEVVWGWDETGLRWMGRPMELTDYGKAFVAWHRQPKDLPTQMDMFEQPDAPAGER